MPGDVFRNMSGPTSWAVSLGLGLAGNTDIFDWDGLLSALIGTIIVLGLAGYVLRRRQTPPAPPSGLPGDEGPRPTA
jgi:hypothetical protein